MTRDRIERLARGVEGFLEKLRADLKTGAYRPAPVREHRIPKPGKPGKYRALGIPTARDRVVQTALKLVLEPIFEPDFWPCSYGFRPKRCTMDAVIHVAQYLWPNKAGDSSYTYVIEGDIKACFDSVDHHVLMDRVRRRIRDKRVLRLIRLFLRAGIMTEGSVRRTALGTPQGGVISPLLANIYLQAIEERYARHNQGPNETPKRGNNARAYDHRAGRPVFAIVRYADDFVVLVRGGREAAEEEKSRLAEHIRDQLRMTLSEEKTLVTETTDGFEFLGYEIKVAPARESGKAVPKILIPRSAQARLRSKVRALTRGHQSLELRVLLMKLNRMLTGWRNYYRYAVGCNRVFARLDNFVWHRIYRWLRRKFPQATSHALRRRFEVRASPTRKAWGDGGVVLRRLTDGGTWRYRYRGPEIENPWDDSTKREHPVALREVRAVRYAMRVLEEL